MTADRSAPPVIDAHPSTRPAPILRFRSEEEARDFIGWLSRLALPRDISTEFSR